MKINASLTSVNKTQATFRSDEKEEIEYKAGYNQETRVRVQSHVTVTVYRQVWEDAGKPVVIEVLL